MRRVRQRQTMSSCFMYIYIYIYNDAIHQLDKLISLSCIAQWLEHSVYNRGVVSSGLTIGMLFGLKEAKNHVHVYCFHVLGFAWHA